MPGPIKPWRAGDHGRRPWSESVNEGMNEAISSITTAHEVNGSTLLRLWEEVRRFWQDRDMRRTTSSFHNR